MEVFYCTGVFIVFRAKTKGEIGFPAKERRGVAVRMRQLFFSGSP